jgi:two-component system, OmpR family, heavy metal sensor histidine kinase CusS
MNKSLKWRLLGWTAGGMALLLGVFGVAVYMLAQDLLWREFDDSLQATARAMASLVKMEDGKIEMDLVERDMPEFSRARRPSYLELWDGKKVLLRSASLGSQDLERLEARSTKALCHTITLPDGRPGRQAVFLFVPSTDPGDETVRPEEDNHEPRSVMAPRPLILAVARDTQALKENLAALRWLLIGAGAGSVVLMLVVASLVVRQGLQPLGALAGRIASISADDLTARVPVEALPREMAPVGERLNELLQRLQAAFHRERTLTGDVAHELRTPLAGMRSTMEVTLSRPRQPEEYRESLAECLEIVGQTQSMADNLLTLARLEGGQAATQPQVVFLAELADSLWRPFAKQAQARGIAWKNHLEPSLECRADVALLKTTLSNLLANAAEYTNGGGMVEATGEVRDGKVEVTLTNTGCTLSAEDVPHVFERFWRGDAARGGTGVHCGLGLSLAERAVAALGGTLAAEVTEGLFKIRLVLPAA